MVLNKIPGADRKLNPQIDTLGGVKQNYQNGSNNIPNVLLNPSFTTNYQPSNAANLPLNIYNQTGDTQQMPRTVKTTITVNGKSKQLTADQYKNYQEYVGTKTKQSYDALSNDPTFMALSPSEQAKVMSNQMTDINDAAKAYLFGGTNNVTKRVNAVLSGQTITAPIKGKTTPKSSKGKTTKVAKSGTSKKSGSKRSGVTKASLSKYSKYALGSTASTSNGKLLRNLVKNASIKSSSSRKVSSKKVTLKKYTPKAAKVARKTSYMV